MVDSYEQWLRRFLRFHHLRHPREMGSAEVYAFLTHLAVEGKVSASTQNQALSALLFLYRERLRVHDLAYQQDLAECYRRVRLPQAMGRKYPHARWSGAGNGYFRNSIAG